MRVNEVCTGAWRHAWHHACVENKDTVMQQLFTCKSCMQTQGLCFKTMHFPQEFTQLKLVTC